MASNRGDILNGVTIMFTVLIWITVPLRMYTRTFIRKSFGWDDFFAVLAFCFSNVLSGWVMYGTHYGVGQHMTALQPPQIAGALKGYFVSELLYVTTTCLMKISFSLMLLRITEKRWIAWGVWVVVAITLIFSLFYFFFILFACRPVEFFWTKALGASGHCRSPVAMTKATYAHGAVMTFGDLSLAILPLFLVRDLHMPTKQKISVMCLLALGSITSVATIARLPLVHHLADADFTYENLDIAVWSVVEANIGIVATALATFRPLLSKMGLMVTSVGASRGHSTGRSDRYQAAKLSKNGTSDPQAIHVTDEYALYDQYYPGRDRDLDVDPDMGAIPNQPRSFRMGFGHNKDAVKVPSTAS